MKVFFHSLHILYNNSAIIKGMERHYSAFYYHITVTLSPKLR